MLGLIGVGLEIEMIRTLAEERCCVYRKKDADDGAASHEEKWEAKEEVYASWKKKKKVMAPILDICWWADRTDRSPSKTNAS